MTFEKFHLALQPKLQGTLLLDRLLGSQELHFFVMLSSCNGILGSRAQANYAAGNTFQDTLAHVRAKSGMRYILLNLGAVQGSDSVFSYPERKQVMARRRYRTTKLEELRALLEYSMSTPIEKDRISQVIVGFDRQSLSNDEDVIALRAPLFRHLPYDVDENC